MCVVEWEDEPEQQQAAFRSNQVKLYLKAYSCDARQAGTRARTETMPYVIIVLPYSCLFRESVQPVENFRTKSATWPFSSAMQELDFVLTLARCYSETYGFG